MTKGVYEMLGLETMSRTEELFNRMDLDNDGNVTEEEFISACSTDRESKS